MSAYREIERVDRCDECDEPADRRCTRCARPLCAAHVLTADGLCTPCEADYLIRSRPRIRPLRMLGIGVYGIASITVGAIVAASIGMLAGQLALGGLLIAPAAVRKVDRERRAFIEELRNRRPALPAGS